MTENVCYSNIGRKKANMQSLLWSVQYNIVTHSVLHTLSVALSLVTANVLYLFAINEKSKNHLESISYFFTIYCNFALGPPAYFFDTDLLTQQFFLPRSVCSMCSQLDVTCYVSCIFPSEYS